MHRRNQTESVSCVVGVGETPTRRRCLEQPDEHIGCRVKTKLKINHSGGFRARGFPRRQPKPAFLRRVADQARAAVRHGLVAVTAPGIARAASLWWSGRFASLFLRDCVAHLRRPPLPFRVRLVEVRAASRQAVTSRGSSRESLRRGCASVLSEHKKAIKSLTRGGGASSRLRRRRRLWHGRACWSRHARP